MASEGGQSERQNGWACSLSMHERHNGGTLIKTSQLGKVKATRKEPRLPAAAKAEDWEAVRQMLREYGAAIINSVDMGGCSIIHWAIRHGNTEFAKELICDPKYAQVLDINMADANGLSPVMLCVKYERTKLLYYLLEAGADFEQPNHEGMTVLTLLDRWMSERGADLRLEKEVINHAIERLQDQVLLARELGVEGMIHTLLSTPSVVAWRKLCELLHQIMMEERDQEHRPESQQIYDIGFPILLHFADLEQWNIQEHLPVMQLLLDLAKVQLFPPLNSQAMAVVAQMMSSCSSTHYKRIRAMGVEIVLELSQSALRRQSQEEEDTLRTSPCAESLYLICFFDEQEEIRHMAKQTLSNLGLDPSKPPDILNWGTAEVILWLSLSLRFNFIATAALREEAIDGPSLLYLNDSLVSRIPHLTTKQCITLLEAVEQLKTEHKNWTGYDVFFSYRRSHSALVRLYALQMRGSFNCFIDMEGLTAGTFTEQILRRIDECRFFVVFFTEGTLERMRMPGDWIVKEIVEALRLCKVIVPVYHHMPKPRPEELVDSIREILNFEAIFDTGNQSHVDAQGEKKQSCVAQLISLLQSQEGIARKRQENATRRSSSDRDRRTSAELQRTYP